MSTLSENFITEEQIQNELNRLRSLDIGVCYDARTPVCITLDYSHSMTDHYSLLKEVLKVLVYGLYSIDRRDVTLIVMAINLNEFGPLFFGELDKPEKTFQKILSKLPDFCDGNTPLAGCFESADRLISTVTEACEVSGQYCTVPVFISVSDTLSTEKPNEYTGILKKILDDVQHDQKLVVELVTSINPDGLNFGGYCVAIDNRNGYENIRKIVQALYTATTAEVGLKKDSFQLIERPPKSDHAAYSAYLSNLMLSTMSFTVKKLGI